MWQHKILKNCITWCFMIALLITGLYLPVIQSEDSAQQQTEQMSLTYLTGSIVTPVEQISDALSSGFRILSDRYRNATDTTLRTYLYKHLWLFLSAAVFLRIYAIFLALSQADNPAIQRHAGMLAYIHEKDGKKRTPSIDTF